MHIKMVFFETFPYEIILEIYFKLTLIERFYFSKLNKQYYKIFNPMRFAGSPFILKNKLNNLFEKNILIKNVDNFNEINFFNNKNFFDEMIVFAFKNFIIENKFKLDFIIFDTYHITALAQNQSDKFMFKIMVYDKNKKNGINDCKNHINVDLIISKLFNQFEINKLTPHIINSIAKFHTDIKFINDIQINNENHRFTHKQIETYDNFFRKFNENQFDKLGSILIMEYSGSDLKTFINDNWESLTLKHWIIIFFQILHCLAIIQEKFPSFKHNELKPISIFVQNINVNTNCFKYKLGKFKFIIPNINIQIKITDFDFSSIDGIIENNLVNTDWANKISINKKLNRYTDIFFFFNCLMSRSFIFEPLKIIPTKIIEFIKRIVPSDFIFTNRGRLIDEIEYTTPYKILTEDPLFEIFRKQPSK